MTTFQIVGITLAVSFTLVSLIATLRHWIGRGSGLLWLILWGLAGVAIALPDLTGIVARALGIARGADLVFYCGILGMLVAFFAVYIRLRQMNHITLLVRQLALQGAPPPNVQEPERQPGGGSVA